MRYMAECVGCGGFVPDREPGVPGAQRKWCSRKCRDAGRVKPKLAHVCRECGVSFEAPGSHRRFCSKRCSDRWHNARQEWRLKPPKGAEKLVAHNAVLHALRLGVLERPGCCEACGVGCVPDAHHDDYLQPLVVEWLCRSCHVSHHQVAA
jgi:hypothetical protein